MHAFFSVFLVTPAYLGKYFNEDGSLNAVGEVGMAVGVVALWALAIPAITTMPTMPKELGGIRWKRTQRMGYLCLTLVLAHLVVLGLQGWMAPGKWTKGLPPISLLAALAALVPLVAKVWSVRADHKKHAD